MGYGVLGILVAVLVFSLGALASPLSPHLSEKRLATIESILRADKSKSNLEKLEERYQRLVQRQVFHDLISIYAPENQSKLKTTYAAFVAEDSSERGHDLGFGLHVIKRLDLDLGEGKTKIIYVNEHWPENRIDRGLFLPDEIRIQTQIKEGKRRVPGSHELYLFDSVRIAWGERADDLEIARRSRFRFDPQSKINRKLQMRVPVSAPYSCQGCHSSTGNQFVAPFMVGQERNYEAIVQDGYFNVPLEKTHGFQQYLEHLRKTRSDAEYIERIKNDLLQPRESFAMPELHAELIHLTQISRYYWIPGDSPVLDGYQAPGFYQRQGIYRDSNGNYFRDAIEMVAEGKYIWWAPTSVIPRP